VVRMIANMARKPRIHIPGGLYHVMLRGNGGQDIFFSPEDHYRMFFLIQEGVERFGHRVLAFCLMGNHIHLAIQVSEVPLSKIMQNLSFRYTRWINSRHQRMGHLFQGRYKALLVEKESYMLELVRYIHLNPVRAGIVAFPVEYEWSGHRAYLGKEHIPWLSCDAVLGQFGSAVHTAREQYGCFVMDALDEECRPEFHWGGDDSRLLGEDRFLQEVMAKTDEVVAVKVSLEVLLAVVAVEFEVDVADICSPSRKRSIAEARGVAAWLVSEIEQHTLAKLARSVHRDPSALSLQVKKVRERAMKETQYRQKIEGIKNRLLLSNSFTHA